MDRRVARDSRRGGPGRPLRRLALDHRGARADGDGRGAAALNPRRSRRRLRALVGVAALLLACGTTAGVDPAPASPEVAAEPIAPIPPADPVAEEVGSGAEEDPPPDEAEIPDDVAVVLREAEEALERRLRLERELDEWRSRAQTLEDRIRAEREESEDLRARLATLEDRLREPAPEERDVAGAPGDPPPSESPRIASAEGTPAEDDEDGRFPSIGGLFGALWSPSENEPAEDAVTEEDSAEPERAAEASAADDAPPADATILPSDDGEVSVAGVVAKPGRYALDAVRTVSGAIDAAEAEPGADLEAIEVRRPQADTVWTIVVNLEEVRAGRGPDLLLLEGDEIVVPESE